MNPDPEDSPRHARTSNSGGDGTRLGVLLDLLLEVSGHERAFLVRARPAEQSQERVAVVASRSKRADGQSQPSQGALERAVSAREPIVCLAVEDPRHTASDVSVRALRLRSILAAPVSTSSRESTALVVDSRGAPTQPVAELLHVLQACAGIAAKALTLDEQQDGRVRSGSRSSSSPAPSAFRRVLAWTERIAPSKLPVLIQGESGSGKEGIARLLHELGPRRAGPFVAVNCTAFSESLLDAELFGAVRGAYTGSDRDRPGLFRAAHGGTLFLDEVGDMPASMQVKLLRAIQEERIRPVGGTEEFPVAVRVVSATHRDLADEVSRGGFRADLYHRLAVLEVRLPALRERLHDLPEIVEQLTPRLLEETGFGPLRLTAAAWEALRSHDWPGNVRELHAVLARALLDVAGGEIDAARLHIRRRSRNPLPRYPAHSTTPLERLMIEHALRSADGNVPEAAKRIGWTRQKLWRRIAALEILQAP